MKTENLGSGVLATYLPPSRVKISTINYKYHPGSTITLSFDMVQTLINFIHTWATDHANQPEVKNVQDH